ncbi:hypothetical protein RR46_02782 [Papilio xuthus]|uniref:Uncharacterized protein n=1 Tax=Papilio xuthus TaxID=66420 RepID=A0A194QCZ9_PAPXU|nr:hypothetical protein RR46_02782 [Papilio xuthus]
MERPSVVSEREAPAKGLVAQVVTMLNGQAQSIMVKCVTITRVYCPIYTVGYKPKPHRAVLFQWHAPFSGYDVNLLCESAERGKLLSECAHARCGPQERSRQPVALHGINKRSETYPCVGRTYENYCGFGAILDFTISYAKESVLWWRCGAASVTRGAATPARHGTSVTPLVPRCRHTSPWPASLTLPRHPTRFSRLAVHIRVLYISNNEMTRDICTSHSNRS